MFSQILYFLPLLSGGVGAFNLYPTLDQDKLATAFGISVGCLDALNETVTCDQTLFQMTNTVDTYLWEADNITTLCTTECTESAQSWWSDVEDACWNDTLSAYGRLIPAASVAERYAEGLDMACLQPSTVIENFSSSPSAVSSSSEWCLIESQNWVGSDIVRPDCPAVIDNSTDPSCSDPTVASPENERIANLYDNDMLCSDCFLKMFHLRMSSSYLPDSDYSDYLADQYQDILNVCSASVTNFTIRALPLYEFAPGTYLDMPIATNDTSTDNTTTVCAGQTIRAEDLDDLVDLDTTGCDEICKKYGVSTGDLQTSIGNYFCTFSLDSYCAPAACTVYQVATGDTCTSIGESVSTTNFTVTSLQIQTWNPFINGFCDDLTVGDYICTSAPGGSYVPPFVANTSTDAATQARGGGDGTTAALAGSGNSTTSPTAPTQEGIISTCNAYYTTPVTGASCAAIENLFLITFAQLYSWNPAIGSNCESLWASEAYCVGIPGSKTSSTSSTTSTTVSIPGPTQSGIISTCNKYFVTPATGASCSAIEDEYSLTFAQFYAWNPAVGDDCQNLYASEAYCVGVSSSTSATTTSATTSTSTSTSTPSSSVTSAAIPGPTQTGIVSSCNKWAVTPATGASCAALESANSITFSQLYAWNPAVGSNCESLWASEAYCVGIEVPGPVQEGITTSCAEYFVTPASGASCAAIESQFDITFAQFYAWNPAVGSNCESLWASEAYCVAV